MKRLISKFKRSFGRSQPTSATDPPIPAITESGAEPAEADRESTPDRKQSCDGRLESLPPEVRRQLLLALDLPRLKAMVRASPTFHQQYLFDRRYILCTSLEKTLGNVTVDAYAVCLYATQDRDTRQDGFLKLLYHSSKSSRQFLPLVDKLTLDETMKAVFFYLQSVKPLIEYYARWILNNLAKEINKDACSQESSQESIQVTLTRTEELRLTRAVYRFQLLCQLADRADDTTSISSRAERVEAFLDLLEPWEIEELFSFYQFAQGVYDRTLNDIRWDLHPDNPKFDDQSRPPTPEGAFDLDNSWDRGNYLEGLTLHGVPLLHTVLFKIKDHRQSLVSTIQQHMTSSYITFNAIEGTLGETQQALRRQNHPSERDRMQEERAPFPFRGDGGESDMPPLAWTIIWDGTYSNLYGCYTSDEMRRWGYVFWDAARLESAEGKVMEFLKQQWWQVWDGDDPRDNLF